MEFDLVWYENKVEIIVERQSRNLLGENSSRGVQKPFQKDHLQINVACIRMPTLKELNESLRSWFFS